VKIAANTLIWGNRVHDLARKLDFLAAHGCQGVEFSQRPEQLGDPRDLGQLLADRGLTLLGLSGGTVDERIKYCAAVLKPIYLYVDRWDEAEAHNARSAGLPLALHPHIFKARHRLADIETELRDHPELRFLPDVAHLTIAGDSPASAVGQWHDRLVAIHVKDWTPAYGRSLHRYRRGFVELGTGIVNFDQLFEKLRTIHYDSWLVFEQGNRDASAEQVVVQATRWLGQRIHGLLKKRTALGTTASPVDNGKPTSNVYQVAGRTLLPPFSLEEEKHFLETMFGIASGSPRTVYPRLAEAVGRLLKARLVILCSYSPAADLMGVIGVYPAAERLGHHFLKYRGSLSSVALERQAATVFDLTSSQPGAPYGQPAATFGYPVLIQRLGLEELISVPVLDPQNPHQARFVVNIFPGSPGINFDDEELARIGQYIAWAADSALDERCAIAAAGANLIAGRCQQAGAFLLALRDLLLETLDCEALTIFLVDDAGTRLTEAISTGLRWASPETQPFYTEGEGIPGNVWKRREPLMSPDPTLGKAAFHKSDEAKANANPSLLCAPMLDASGCAVGVIRCQNKRGNLGDFHMFSEDDLAVLDAVCRAAVPHLQVLLSKERRVKALRRLTHELNNPLVALKGAVDKMRRELERRRGTTEAYFSQDYIEDIESWLGLMRGLLGNADLLSFTSKKLVLEQRRVQLYGDVFMPAVQQILQPLLDRDFETSGIVIRKFDEIPALWLDKIRFIQVVFNLLTNAIKYAEQDPKRFRVLVVARESQTHFEIAFSDWGSGISSEMKEAIFFEGVRSKDAEQNNVSGDGLGLWIARNIVQAHGGKIDLTGFRDPTTFTISLPKWLAKRKASTSDPPAKS
jgi:sugar phosphate isomerase/epimerase/nitrogen-specific signal transduction histidine kinase